MSSVLIQDTQNNSKKKRYFVLVFICFYAVCSLLSLNRHSKANVFNYHSEIFSDKSGYYIYLPTVFIYNFDAEKLPSQIDKKTGFGFTIDSSSNKIVTKYTYGVALMQSPFFLVAHLLAKPLGFSPDGFSFVYNKMIDFAGVFYADLALIFLFLFLIRYVSKRTAIIALCGLFLGTNLFYYSIFDTGMSHVYSFFLFSVFLYLSGFIFKSGRTGLIDIIFGLVIGLIIIVRPINVIFLPVFFMFNQPDWKEIKSLIKPILTIACSATILVIPQLLYWKYLSGHFFIYSYPNEGFTNVLCPKMLNLWFSTNNGLFLFSPLVIFILSGFIFMRKAFPLWTIILSLYFIFISYVFSSWWSWSYGCSYGSRPFVEYYTLFSLPFCFSIDYILKSKWRLYLLGTVFIFCVAWNLKLIFSYDGCWYGGDWDWQHFAAFVMSPTK